MVSDTPLRFILLKVIISLPFGLVQVTTWTIMCHHDQRSHPRFTSAVLLTWNCIVSLWCFRIIALDLYTVDVGRVYRTEISTLPLQMKYPRRNRCTAMMILKCTLEHPCTWTQVPFVIELVCMHCYAHLYIVLIGIENHSTL